MKNYIFIRTWSPTDPTIMNAPSCMYRRVLAKNSTEAFNKGAMAQEILDESYRLHDQFVVDYVITV